MFTKKDLVVAALVMLATAFGIFSYQQNKKINAAEKKYEILEKESNKFKQKQVQLLDSLEKARLKGISDKQKQIDSLAVLYEKERNKSKKLQGVLDSISAGVDSIPADSSYSYWNKTYPPISDQIYPLDSLQIKQAHKVDLMYKTTTALVESLKESLRISEEMLVGYKKSTDEYRDLYNITKQQKDIIASDNRRLVIEIEGLNKTIDQQRFLSKLLAAGVVTTGVIIIIKSVK